MTIKSPGSRPDQDPTTGPEDASGARPVWYGVLAVVILTALIGTGLWIGMELTRGPSTASQYPTDPTVTAYAEAFATTHPPRPTEPPPAATPAPAVVSVPTAAPTAASGQTSLSGAATAARATNVTARAAATPPAAATEPPAAPTAAPASTVEVTVTAERVEDVQPAAAETAQVAGGSEDESGPSATAAPATSRGAPVPVSGPISIDDPAAEQDVLNAYSNYSQVEADALYSLDASALPSVSDGWELQKLTDSIAEDRSMGRALLVSVRLHPIVVRVEGDDAEVVDIYQDSSIWVNPTTKDPLPGEVAPATPDDAPTVSTKFELHRTDGIWKVTRATSYTCAESADPSCDGVSG
jgi:hypothetical protein